MSKARIHTRNLAVNWFGHAANLAVMFFLSPFIIHSLGKVDYGVWCLLVAVTGYMGLLDIGIRASTGRFVIFHTGRDEHDHVNAVVQNAMGFFTALVMVLVIAAIFLGWWFPDLFDVGNSYRAVATLILPLLAVNIWVTAFSTVMSSVLASRDRYDLVQLVNLVTIGVRAGGTVLVLTLGWGLLGLVGVLLAAQTVGLVGNVLLAHRVSGSLKVWPFHIRRDRLRELIAFSIPVGVAAVAYKIIHQTDLVVVGAATNVALVTVYAIGALLPEYVWGFVDQVCMTFFPPIQRAAARDDHPPMHGAYLRQGRMALLVGLPIYVGIMIFGPRFLELWMGGGSLTDADLRGAAVVMRILCGARLVFLFGIGAAPLLTAIGHIRFNAVIGVVEAVTNLALSLVLVLVAGMGLPGVALGTLASMAVVRGVIHPWYACRKGHLAVERFWERVIVPGLTVAALFVAWSLVVRMVIPASGWGGLTLQIALALIGYVPMCYFLLLFGIDRRRILYVVQIGLRRMSR
ncbi:MAG: lipopolysaccharide biosynthesis protein [Planctomycetota bacterium]|jgi:O-antigen/teichoic acid export membrane protein